MRGKKDDATVRFQSLSQPLTLVSNVKEIPKDATIIWYDFENATDEENEYLKIILISIT